MDSSHPASYSNHSGGFIDSREFHTSYRNDLLPFYDKDWVLDKLFKPSATLNIGPTLSQDDVVLDALAMEVRANCAEDLEAIDEAQKNKNDKEAVIQSSLCTLFQAIEEAVANRGYCTPRQYFRRFVPDTTPLVDESGEVKPDFILADVPEPDNGLATSPPSPEKLDSLRRVMAHAFIKVKAKEAYSPVPAPSTLHKKAAKMTLVQGSDYACLLRAARPLITHLFGVFFCGNSFSIAHFDYSGINISPQFSILPNDNAGLRQFIRVFLRMTMEMSPYELGCDPTCFLEPPTQTYYQAQFPSFAVTMGGIPGSDKPNTWVRTVGKPLFSSCSFFERGTSVWLAFNEDTHEPTILKNSWRTPNRDPESTIYQKIREKIGDEHVRGLATVTGGGDVYFEGEPLSVATVRDSPALLDPTETNRVLHRVTLSQVGKPLYDYTCLEELGIALLDALHAHEKLSSHGVLHRDISIGNVMILVDAFYNNDPTLLDPGKRVEIRNRSEGNFGGLLTDFDYAKILDLSDPSSSPGDGSPTGTPLFMASELLWSIYYQKPCPMHTVYHDLESFDWVALYAIYKHALGEVPTTHPLHRPLAREFARLFTAVSPKNVFERRIIAFSLDGIPSLLAYADSIAEPESESESESERLGAFLIGVWGELKATFEGHRDWQSRVDRERPSKKRRIHRPGREVVRYLSEKFRDFPAVAREVSDALATDSEAENSDDETLDDAEDEEDAEASSQLDPAFPVPCYKYEDQVLKVNVLIGK